MAPTRPTHSLLFSRPFTWMLITFVDPNEGFVIRTLARVCIRALGTTSNRSEERSMTVHKNN